jgi:hypothetical protein
MLASKELRVKATFDLFVRFVDRVDWSFRGCQLWKARTDQDGYGVFQMGRQLKTRGHRIAYALYYGAVPEETNVCHSCDTPGCVRREHLWLGTNGENNRDRARKGRSAVGWRNGGAWNGGARLADDEVTAILEDPRTHMEIAKAYGIGHSSVSNIKNGGQRWRHVAKGRTDRRALLGPKALSDEQIRAIRDDPRSVRVAAAAPALVPSWRRLWFDLNNLSHIAARLSFVAGAQLVR